MHCTHFLFCYNVLIFKWSQHSFSLYLHPVARGTGSIDWGTSYFVHCLLTLHVWLVTHCSLWHPETHLLSFLWENSFLFFLCLVGILVLKDKINQYKHCSYHDSTGPDWIVCLMFEDMSWCTEMPVWERLVGVSVWAGLVMSRSTGRLSTLHTRLLMFAIQGLVTLAWL